MADMVSLLGVASNDTWAPEGKIRCLYRWKTSGLKTCVPLPSWQGGLVREEQTLWEGNLPSGEVLLRSGKPKLSQMRGKQDMHSKRLFRLLGLSMLVAVGVMAMSASGAQAKWLLLVNKESVGKVTGEGSFSGGQLLEQGGLGIKVTCAGGTGTATATSVEEGKKVTGSGSANFTGCDVVGNPEKCTVNSPGKTDGNVTASGTGELSHKEGLVYILLESEEFTTLIFGGALCPFNEVEAIIAGKAHIEIHNALEDLKLHQGLLDELALTFGGNTASLHPNGASTGVVPVSLTEAGGGTWAIHLLAL